ncbi:MAG: proliferating cell nuclear antigen (pcna) [Candidatus Woesearchaeota archaeon]|jgi:proliferating cell nuclear antigen|nr:proliferating cell nuclear antigen (pcna) [Candidatus Woesearchaeota archaeon]MDP7181737.1 proliferating cell nuclear antigen (pcna) [Candidatus Woesearchaeota archaeon]MDP7198826.1 proliferating cell nuclear antigen (pcna) [Candidatus Woesearchaeota archaeon]MDP7467174.1 proliferating cell nuclear antigen (pcna) [Candidatus Woesearchaeota archaeon]MDP7647491.1 proliferating cell nuclear antigen (pcna) [Candidatus Woesearchaeota archaeon]
MKVVLADATPLRDSISLISDLVTEATIKISKEGIELAAMDPANVAMVVFKLLGSTFVESDIPEEQKIAVNLANLKQVLKRATPSDMLTLEVEEGKLSLKLKGQTTRTFSTPLLDLDDKEQKIPSLTFPIKASMPSSVLADAVDDAGVVGESVTLGIEPDTFFISSEGDLSKAHVEVKKSEEVIVETNSEANIKSKYSLEYLKKMVQAGKLADNVTLQFNQDYPLKVDYTVQDKLQLSFILAPRVDND